MLRYGRCSLPASHSTRSWPSFPALIAVVSIYGLFADPSTIANQLNSVTSALPEQARQVITDQVTMLASRRSTLAIGLIISVVIALWSASAGVSNLLTTINVAYDEEEKRGFVKKRLLSLGLTLGAIVFMVIVLGLVAVLLRCCGPCSGRAPCVGSSKSSAGWCWSYLLLQCWRSCIAWGPTATRHGRPGYQWAL
jgi:membrane protein